MRKLLLSLTVLAFLQGCGPKVDLPEGAPPYLKTKELIEKAEAQALEFETLSIKGKGRYEENGKGQSFRFEIRLAKDSLIWVDIADPFLGLKVARAVLSQQEVSYYNRLERNYRQGPTEQLSNYLGFAFDFAPMMSVLSASFSTWDMDWYQDYQAQFYQLHNFSTEEGAAPPAAGLPLMSQMLHAQSFRPVDFKLRRPESGQNLQIALSNYESFTDFDFPTLVEMNFQEAAKKLNLRLDIADVKRNEKLSYPFRIPPSYEKL